MVSSQRIPTIAILCIFIGALQQVLQMGKRREKTKKATENHIESSTCSQKSDVPHTNSSMHRFPVTQSSLLGFSWNSDNIT